MEDVKILSDIYYDTKHGLALDIYLPVNSEPKAVFIFYHGGGFENYRQKDMGKPLSIELAKNGIVCVNPSYRHYPQAHFPDFIEDGAAAVAWTMRHIQEYCMCSDVFIGGHSAGAYLSMLLCFDERYLYKFDIDPRKDIKGFIFASGQPTAHFNVLKERGMDPRSVIIDETAPLYYVKEEGAPLLVICTTNDIENRLEETNLFISTLKHFHYKGSIEYHVLEGYGHSNYLFPDAARPEKPSFGSRMITEFIQKQL